jgi:hypothetical protein
LISQYFSIDSNIKSTRVFERGIEKPIHCAFHEIAVLIHITFPSKLMSGPQLFPGLIAASVCNNPESFSFSASMVLFIQLITQRETEF